MATQPARLLRPYVDVHAHIGQTINRVPPVGQTAEKYLARMAKSGVVAAILCPAAGGPLARGVLDTREQNVAVATACQTHPDRFPLGLAIIEVRHQQAGVEELDRAMRDDGLAGLMCHPGLSGHALGEELYPALEVVDGRGGLALLHVGGRGTEARAAACARRFRRTTFIMAHVSMAKDQHAEAAKHLANLDNAWFDFAQHPAGADDLWDLRRLVHDFGDDRLLFGSDSPYYDHRLLQAQIEQAPLSALSERVKDRLAFQNAVTLIQHFRPAWRLPAAPPQLPSAFAGVDLWAQQPGRPGRLA